MSRALRCSVALVVSVAIVFSRRPDAFLNPQFWAEDGAVWFADAYNRGVLVSFLIPNAGYVQTLSRIGGALALLVPLAFAPAVMNAIAVAVQVAPALLLVSDRFARLVPPLRWRAAMAFVYLALPNSWETHANLTNAQWRLGLILMMLLIAPAATRWGRVADVLVAFIASLSGPFGILAMPVVALRWVAWRERSFIPLAAATTAGSLLQGVVILANRGARSGGALEASLAGGVRIIGGQVALGALVGERGLRFVLARPWAFAACVVATLLVVLVATGIARSRNKPLQWFGLWAGVILIAGMLWPVGGGASPAWPFLAEPGNNGRYWFAPMLVFSAGLMWMAMMSRRVALRAIAAAALLLLPVGIVADWRHRPYADLHWGDHARHIESTIGPAEFLIPINPPGLSMRLVRR